MTVIFSDGKSREKQAIGKTKDSFFSKSLVIGGSAPVNIRYCFS
jgi:hypothetical protein